MAMMRWVARLLMASSMGAHAIETRADEPGTGTVSVLADEDIDCTCEDDPDWTNGGNLDLVGWGRCESYVAGGYNEGKCAEDGADLYCPVSCNACPDCSSMPALFLWVGLPGVALCTCIPIWRWALSTFGSGNGITVKAAERHPPRSSSKLPTSMAQLFRQPTEITCSARRIAAVVATVAALVTYGKFVATSMADEDIDCTCEDDPDWTNGGNLDLVGWGRCESYAAGGYNEGKCAEDGADLYCPVSCNACPDCSSMPALFLWVGLPTAILCTCIPIWRWALSSSISTTGNGDTQLSPSTDSPTGGPCVVSTPRRFQHRPVEAEEQREVEEQQSVAPEFSAQNRLAEVPLSDAVSPLVFQTFLRVDTDLDWCGTPRHRPCTPTGLISFYQFCDAMRSLESSMTDEKLFDLFLTGFRPISHGPPSWFNNQTSTPSSVCQFCENFPGLLICNHHQDRKRRPEGQPIARNQTVTPKQWWLEQIGSVDAETKVGKLAKTLETWMVNQGHPSLTAHHLSHLVVEKMGWVPEEPAPTHAKKQSIEAENDKLRMETRVRLDHFLTFVQYHMPSGFIETDAAYKSRLLDTVNPDLRCVMDWLVFLHDEGSSDLGLGPMMNHWPESRSDYP